MKTFAGLEVVEWVFLAISVVNVLVAFGITIDRLIELEKDKPDYTFAIILFINIGTLLVEYSYNFTFIRGMNLNYNYFRVVARGIISWLAFLRCHKLLI